jgi:hypothetical protein
VFWFGKSAAPEHWGGAFVNRMPVAPLFRFVSSFVLQSLAACGIIGPAEIAKSSFS